LNFTNLELRASDTLASIGGLYFSTFFGGDDSSWASPSDQFTYYKNMQVFAGQGAATGEGAKSGADRLGLGLGLGVWVGVAVVVLGMIM
jgi:hypothetical protein